MVQYCKSTGAPLHDLIDFMCITALADNPTSGAEYQKAYSQSLKTNTIVLLIDDDEGDDAAPAGGAVSAQ